MSSIDLGLARARWHAMQERGLLTFFSASDAQLAYGADAGGAQRQIAGALQLAPMEPEQLSTCVQELMRIAGASKVPVYPISTGRNWGYGSALPPRDGCVIIDLSRQVTIDMDPELGVVTLQPGVTQGMLADFLDQNGYDFLVPVTGAGPTCSLVGNALERGYGVTPHTDHFSAVTDLEAVLADATVYRTALREAGGEQLARLFKWGIGAYSAGLFTQSGFGIVTRMSIVLARRPESVKVCLFNINDEALLGPAVERVRTILTRLPGTAGGINLMNRHRVLAMSAPYPASEVGDNGLIPEALIAQLGRERHIAPWTGFATLYGTRRMVAAAQKEIRQALNGVASRILFVSPERAAALARLASRIPGRLGRKLGGTLTTLASSLELVNGRPNETALPLAYWRQPRLPKQQWRDPARDGCGLIWFAPLVPMRAAHVLAYVAMARRVTAEHGLEPLITLTSISDKLFDSTIPLLFDRADPAAVIAAKACYSALLLEGRALTDGEGQHLPVFPYRLGIDAMHALNTKQTDSGAFHRRLQRSLDPENLIAPGRYQ